MLWHAAFAQCSVPGSVLEQCRMRPVTFDEVDFALAHGLRLEAAPT